MTDWLSQMDDLTDAQFSMIMECDERGGKMQIANGNKFRTAKSLCKKGWGVIFFKPEGADTFLMSEQGEAWVTNFKLMVSE
jgi:hypothetical protein